MNKDFDPAKLAAEGFLGTKGALALTGLAAFAGFLIGLAYFVPLFNFLIGLDWAETNQYLGPLVGALLGAFVAVIKVRKGNLEALEAVGDAEWRRSVNRAHRDKP